MMCARLGFWVTPDYIWDRMHPDARFRLITVAIQHKKLPYSNVKQEQCAGIDAI